MADDQGTIREVVWQDLCPCLIILRVFRLATRFRVLVLAAVALVSVTAGWRMIGSLYSGTEDLQIQAWSADLGAWPWEETGVVLIESGAAPPSGRVEMFLAGVPVVGGWLASGPIIQAWSHIAAPFIALFDTQLTLAGFTFLALCCLWSLLVWSLFGGAITRIVSLELTRDESLGMASAMRYSSGRWLSYFCAPLVPLVGVLFAALLLSILGLLMYQADFFVFTAGFLWPLVLVTGLFMAIVIIGLAAGWPLMIPTISTEGTDAFDALSRSYAYVYQRPLHFLLYAIFASLLGVVGFFIVDLFADAIVGLSAWGVGWGVGIDRMDDIAAAGDDSGWLLRSGSAMLGFWTGSVMLLKSGFQFAFFWATATAIYLLLRRHVDATEMSEIALEEQQEMHGLPPLATDESGIPGVADETP